MIDSLLNRLPGRGRPGELHWLSPKLAIAAVCSPAGWRRVFAAGIRAVVDLDEDGNDQGPSVRGLGMRYVRLCISGSPMPLADDLHIIAAWIGDRMAGDGPVLVRDGGARFNAGLIGAAALVRGGLPPGVAMRALARSVPERSLDAEQQAELARFAATYEAEPPWGRRPSPGKQP